MIQRLGPKYRRHAQQMLKGIAIETGIGAIAGNAKFASIFTQRLDGTVEPSSQDIIEVANIILLSGAIQKGGLNLTGCAAEGIERSYP